MKQQLQSFANHRRYHAPFHYFAVPVLLINVVWRLVQLLRDPSGERAWELVLALALATVLTLARTYPLKVQDRVIRLEERLRLERLLPPELAARVSELSAGQLCALRFCDDAELPALASSILTGGTRKRDEIKRQIRTWRADEFRV